jgi:hypothetical protein
VGGPRGNGGRLRGLGSEAGGRSGRGGSGVGERGRARGDRGGGGARGARGEGIAGGKIEWGVRREEDPRVGGGEALGGSVGVGLGDWRGG